MQEEDFMKVMNVEKRILAGTQIDQLASLKAIDRVNYEENDTGIQASGVVEISGQYLLHDEVFSFNEEIELEVFAPNEKRTKEPFQIRISDVNGVVDQGILVSLDFEISGIKEASDEPLIVNQNEDEISIEAIEDLFEDENETFTGCRLIVAKPYDTYESIAARYNLDVNLLRKANQYREIMPKQLVLIP